MDVRLYNLLVSLHKVCRCTFIQSVRMYVYTVCYYEYTSALTKYIGITLGNVNTTSMKLNYTCHLGKNMLFLKGA